MKIYHLPILLLAPVSLLAQERAIEGQSLPGHLSIRYQPPSVTLQASLQDANGNQALDAEEASTLRVTATNAGPGKALDLQFRLSKISAAPYLSLPKSAESLNLLKPGESKVIELPLNTAFETPAGRISLRLDASEKNNNPISPLDIVLETRAFAAPDLAMTDVGIDDSQGTYAYGNGNGKIEKGETIEIKAIVQNRGQGEAGNVTVKVEYPTTLFFVGRSEFNLGDLSAGAFREVSFAITVPPNYADAVQLPVKLDIREARGRYGKTVPLNLVLNETARRAADVVTQQVAIAGRDRPDIDIQTPPLLTVDVDVNIPKTAMRRPDAVALVIGNQDYLTHDVPKVEFAQRDAAVVKEYLVKSLGYREENIIYLFNATRAQMDAALGTAANHQGRLFSYVKPGRSEVFVYFSGHGAPDPSDKKGYLVPVDADPAFINLNGYSLETFYKNLNKLPATFVTVVVDACFSGASESGMLLRNASPVFIQVENPALAATNAVVFTSAGGDQISSWYPEKRHSLFTYFFLKGLSGAADANSDHKVTVAEMNTFINDQVPYLARRLHNREQTPLLLPSAEMLGPRAQTILVEY